MNHKKANTMGTAFMNSESASGSGSNRSSGERTDSIIRWVGDLDHPFYNDERSRFVWYEASAVAFQMLFLGIYLMAGLMLWIGGADAMPYALPFLGLAVISALVLKSVVGRNSAEYFPNKFDLTRTRGKVVLVAFLFLLGGAMRAFNDLGNGTDGGFLGGFASAGSIGLALGAVAGVVGVALEGRRHRKAEALAELSEE